MKMYKLFLMLVLAGAMPLTMMAQDDDLYFTPSKQKSEKKSSVKQEQPTYYVGSTRDVDEYNRRGHFRSSYQKVGTDSLGNDIIEFQAGTGIYPDTSYVDTLWVAPARDYEYSAEDEYALSRRMSRWDGYYGWYDPWYFGRWGWHPFGYYSWYDPWYYYGAYGGWYDWWYDPWYYAHYGWGYPWYYGRWGYDPYYWGGGYYGGGYAYSGSRGSGHAGTMNYYDRSNYGNRGYSANHRGSSGSAGGTYTRNGVTYGSGNKGLGTRRPTPTTRRSSPSGSSYTPSSSGASGGHTSFGGSHSSYGGSSGSSSFGGSHSSSGGGSSSFGGSRSGGGGGGGGGHAGGRR